MDAFDAHAMIGVMVNIVLQSDILGRVGDVLDVFLVSWRTKKEDGVVDDHDSERRRKNVVVV
eukprot:5997480-Ditylum_brightwellii.AAC.2